MSAEYTFTVERELEDGCVTLDSVMTVEFDAGTCRPVHDDVEIAIAAVYVTVGGHQMKLEPSQYDKRVVEELCHEHLAQAHEADREARAEAAGLSLGSHR